MWGRAPLLVLLVALAAGCGDDEASTVPPGATRAPAIPHAMLAFLVARGTPHIYTVAFADAELGDDGIARPVDPPRRIDDWTWAGDPTRQATFDSGLFVGEQTLPLTLGALPVPAVGPTSLRAGMTPEEVDARMGGGFTQETAMLGGRPLTVVRYPSGETVPPAAFGFIGGELVTAVVGYAMTPEGGGAP